MRYAIRDLGRLRVAERRGVGVSDAAPHGRRHDDPRHQERAEPEAARLRHHRDGRAHHEVAAARRHDVRGGRSGARRARREAARRSGRLRSAARAERQAVPRRLAGDDHRNGERARRAADELLRRRGRRHLPRQARAGGRVEAEGAGRARHPVPRVHGVPPLHRPDRAARPAHAGGDLSRVPARDGNRERQRGARLVVARRAGVERQPHAHRRSGRADAHDRRRAHHVRREVHGLRPRAAGAAAVVHDARTLVPPAAAARHVRRPDHREGDRAGAGGDGGPHGRGGADHLRRRGATPIRSTASARAAAAPSRTSTPRRWSAARRRPRGSPARTRWISRAISLSNLRGSLGMRARTLRGGRRPLRGRRGAHPVRRGDRARRHAAAHGRRSERSSRGARSASRVPRRTTRSS